jgi:tRNA nucleotidyltransferase (CCA-adding enzyme)
MNDSIDTVLNEAYTLVEPSIEDRRYVARVADTCLNNVKMIASRYEDVSDVMLVGSYAKDTWLKDSVDIDIFVKIKPTVDSMRFEYIGKSIGFEALKDYNPYLRYSQHPYVEAIVDGIRVNVVPCYDVAIGNWKSAADRSPYHTLYMLDRLDHAKRREVRLLKRFMKVIGVYGAEIAVQGFSGYVCEVLVLIYGSFINTLARASRWREGEVIALDQANIYTKANDGDNSALIIIDPIDKHRNLGSAISYECVGRFILAARNFLAKPSIDYFKYSKNSIDINKLKASPYANNILIIEFAYKKRSDDIIWGQLKSSANSIVKQLSMNNFNVLRYKCYLLNDKAYIILLLDSLSIPPFSIKHGPSVFDANNAYRFIAKNKDSLLWLDNKGRVNAIMHRRFTYAKDMVSYILKEGLYSSGISKGLIEDLKQGFNIYTLNGKDNNIIDKLDINIVRAVYELITSDRYAFQSS